ncbi:hypothetical protein [Rhizobium rhizogenes]|uniref:hypothetical protein n=1 Tax=Rhizobium rhizogenes TaxID=359 RepID=UPI0024BD9E3D|nr:hypothetical protein [Rhizobium rhizogenes]MDJ1633195.1 hypothetical protein [Rhizobium rhizogenes]
MNAWATTIISGLVLIVAFMQWRTAHQKVILDLFNRRMAVYEKLGRSMRLMNVSAKVSDDSNRLFLEAQAEATFVFGRDIHEYLRELWLIFVDSRTLTRDNGYNSTVTTAQQVKLMRTVSDFYNKGPDRFAPYMRMDQKLCRNPAQWFEDANKRRLSYADEKQR